MNCTIVEVHSRVALSVFLFASNLNSVAQLSYDYYPAVDYFLAVKRTTQSLAP